MAFQALTELWQTCRKKIKKQKEEKMLVNDSFLGLCKVLYTFGIFNCKNKGKPVTLLSSFLLIS